MPFPPPPPPPGPPAPTFGGGKVDGDSHGVLLQSIRMGTTLKKTVTNDRSGPAVLGKVSGAAGNANSTTISSSGASSESTRSNGLGGLFASGMPKLKPAGRPLGDGTTSSSRQVQSQAQAHSTPQQDLGRRPFPSDIRNRGPPPQPPPANQKPSMPTSASDSVLTGGGKAGNNNSYGSQNHLGGSGPPSLPSKPPVGGYGKPNLAPKPPSMSPGKPSPPPKKLVMNGNPNRVPVMRAQSMRVPRSPPVAPPSGPPFPPSKELGTYRTGGTPGLPPFHQSQDSLHYRTNPPPPPRTATLPSNLNHHGLKATAPLPPPSTPPPPAPSTRPLRPPMTRPPPPPSRLGAANAPMCPPPPPPTSAPPPPPHHRLSPAPPPPPPPSQQTRLAPAVPSSAPPPPPVRNSSMRNGSSPAGSDLETRFADLFHLVQEFPPPQSFRKVPKVYNSRSVKQAAPFQAKQQAPQPPQLPPPMHVQLGSKLWASDTSSC